MKLFICQWWCSESSILHSTGIDLPGCRQKDYAGCGGCLAVAAGAVGEWGFRVLDLDFVRAPGALTVGGGTVVSGGVTGLGEGAGPGRSGATAGGVTAGGASWPDSTLERPEIPSTVPRINPRFMVVMRRFEQVQHQPSSTGPVVGRARGPVPLRTGIRWENHFSTVSQPAKNFQVIG